MFLNQRYCSQCGHDEIDTQLIEERTRQVCLRCGTIFYQNPLPVAATVVLNDRREVLLVKRKNKPYQGMWCLPMGFAELSETIAEAAQRELAEETGLTGRIVRLLSTDSTVSDVYGDLLVVTFEAERTAGTERPGDDAAGIEYFPLDRVPPLAFAPNATAIKAAEQFHGEEWSIQDSFKHMQTEDEEEMLSDALVKLIRDSAREISDLWLAEVLTNPTTKSYRHIDASQLHERAEAALSQFGRWLKGTSADDEVRNFYRAIGTERKRQGFAVQELLSSLMILRKHIWLFARSRGVWERPIDVYRVLELDRRIVVFFDKAIYHAIRGLTEANPY
jgi:8-oxo-dGTP diphosphatase